MSQSCPHTLGHVCEGPEAPTHPAEWSLVSHRPMSAAVPQARCAEASETAPLSDQLSAENSGVPSGGRWVRRFQDRTRSCRKSAPQEPEVPGLGSLMRAKQARILKDKSPHRPEQLPATEGVPRPPEVSTPRPCLGPQVESAAGPLAPGDGNGCGETLEKKLFKETL